jgi:hypothetical protein
MLFVSMPAWAGAQPTGAGNNAGQDANSLTVSFSKPGGIYTSNIEVALSASESAAKIRYTTDGSEPTEQSRLYIGPVSINASVLFKATAFDSGQHGPIACETYTLADASVATFTSNLPLIIINTFGQEIPRDPKLAVSIRVIDSGKGRAGLLDAANFDGRALLNLRGHTSLRYPKRSYLLKTRDAANNPLKCSLLSLPKESDWVLYAPYSDKTLMRDVLAYELSNQMGRYAPCTRFVEVFVNDTAGPLSQRHYLGVFVLVEKIKRAKQRVNIAKLNPEETTEAGLSGGYIFKKDHSDRVDMGPPNLGGFPTGGSSSGHRDGFPTGPGGFPGDPRGFLPTRGGADPDMVMFFSGRERSLGVREGFVSSRANQFLYVEPEPDEITPAQRRWLIQHVKKVEAALYGADFLDPQKGYAAYLDADSFIDHHLLVEVTKNIDGFRFSTFYHKDRGGRLAMGPIWDWNLSFGNASGKQGHLAEYWYWPQLDDQQYTWFRRLFEDPNFAQKYVDRWGTLRTNQFALTKILARVDELAALLDEAQVRNYRKWKILGRPVWPNHYVGRSYADEVQHMKGWIEQRWTWIDQQFLHAPAFSVADGKISPGTKLLMASATGAIYYTMDGSDPRAPGGGISPDAQEFRGAVVLDREATVTARVLDGKRWSWPGQAKFTVR